jgi:hypothetical protein
MPSGTVAHLPSKLRLAMHLTFYIGLGIGLALAAGLRPFLPALLVGGLGSAGALGVGFAHSRYDFLGAGWWLGVIGAMLVLSYALDIRRPRSTGRGLTAAAVSGLGTGVGALLFAGMLAGHGYLSWPGLIAGALSASLSGLAARPIIGRASARLDSDAQRALALYLDGIALLLAALTALLHPLGYLFGLVFVWLAISTHRSTPKRYAGLRILGR